MAEHLFKNWIVYVLFGGFIYFLAYLLIKARQEEKKGQDPNKPQEKR